MIGKVLGNRYEILEKVGSGGMANVYKAKDRMLNRFVALKVLHSEFKEDEEFLRRFNIESQAAASLSHQNIVQIYDVGEEDSVQYIVMEYLNGKTLKEYIKSKEGGLYWKEAVDYSMQICRALEHAHQKHIIHRDIKPQNIVITGEGILKVTDFGIARAANNNTTKMNSTAIGSAHYLSPEQARGGYTDQRSDIYSLGVVMYELFTGKLPFDAESPVAVAMKHIQEAPVPPRKLNPSIPPGIEKIILKAMSKEVRLRYASAGEVLQDLKLLYVNPNAKISVEDNSGAETKVIDSDEINRRTNGTSRTDRRSEDRKNTNQRRKKKKNNGAMIAGVAAAAVAAVMLIVALVLALNAFLGGNTPEVQVPDLSGLTVEQARARLRELGDGYSGINIVVDVYENNKAEKETIINQTPAANEMVSEKGEIRVILSNGPGAVVLGNYMGESYNKIERDLTGKGLEVVKLEENSDNFPSGIIVRQDPQSGTSLSGGDIVTLYVSKGSANAIVPSVIGYSEADARIAIETGGLNVGSVVHEYNDKYVRGLVYDQGYTPFTRVPEGTRVDIFISDGPKPKNDDNKETENKNEEPEDEPKKEETPEADPEPADNSNKPEPVDDPSQIEEMKTTYLKLSLPADRTRVTVKLVCDGQVIYEKEHNTASGLAEISLKSRGTKKVDIYYDNEFEGTREVVFN